MVFVDTSALYALMDGKDPNHERAGQAWATLAPTESIITHNYVLVETSALLQRRHGIDAVDDLHDRVVPAIQIVWVGERDHEAALTAVVASKRRDVSLVDRVSFHTMRKLRLERALAFDAHFEEEGFELVV